MKLFWIAALAFLFVLSWHIMNMKVPAPAAPPAPKGRLYTKTPPPPVPPQAKFPEPPPPPPCEFRGLSLPPNFKVFAAEGGDGGKSLDFALDGTGRTRQIDVGVNADVPVVLFLSSRASTVWNIGWTRRTRIAAVFVSGFNAQRVAGVTSDTPVMIVTRGSSSCPDAFINENRNIPANALSRRFFAKPIDGIFPSVKGRILIGNPPAPGAEWVTSDWHPVSYFAKEIRPVAPDREITEAMLRGDAHLATADEMEMAARFFEKKWTKPEINSPQEFKWQVRNILKGYFSVAITRPFVVPGAALNPGHYFFIVMPGAERQNAGGLPFNMIHLSNGQCAGQLCEYFKPGR
jgi:hypothetical protein